MKKITSDQKRWLYIHARNSFRRRQCTKPIKYKPGRFIRGEIRIGAPSDLCLSKNFKSVTDFIDRIFAVIPKAKAFVDFKTIKSVSPDAALLLAASLDMWQRFSNVNLRTRDIDKWSPEVAHIFRSLGLFDLLRTPGQALVRAINSSDIHVLKLSSGQGADGSLANQLIGLLKEISVDFDTGALFVGLTEAMTNVGQHAYPKDLIPEHIPDSFKRWWMTGSYNKMNNCLRILILDLGVGIPLTLPRSELKEIVAGILSKIREPDDADRIDAAVQVGRTSTNSRGRGNGLDDIRRFVEQYPDGRLRILSGRGEVVYTTGNAYPKKITHATSIPGTLIEWEIFR